MVITDLDTFLKITEYCEPYYKLGEDVKSLILLQDEVDDRFKTNDYINLIACTILYHQIVDKFIESLIYQRVFLLGSRIQSKVIIDSSYSKKLNKLEKMINEFGTYFDHDELFIEKARCFNDLRNEVAHHAIKTDNREVINKMNLVRKDYHLLQNIYQTASIDIYNSINSKRKSFINNPNKSLFTKKNIDKLRKHISNNAESAGYISEVLSDVIHLYKVMYENTYKDSIGIDINQTILGIDYGFITVDELLRGLRIND